MLQISRTSRLAARCARRPRTVIALWAVAALAALAGVAGFLGAALTSDDDFTGTPESRRAELALHAAFPPRPGAFDADEAVIVHSRTLRVDDPAFEQHVARVVERLERLVDDGTVAAIATARTAPGEGLVSRDRHATAILVDLRGDVAALTRLVADTRAPGLAASVIGEASIDEDFTRAADRDLRRGEIVGLGLALIVLLAVFGTVAASLVPVLMAVTAIVVALGVVALIGQAFPLSFFVVNLLVMMGMAVGIDYSLFVVSRFREERRAGRALPDAIAIAGGTAGHAVVFSGVTVVLALIGMFLIPQTLFRSLATGAIVAVLVSVMVALTLLPAALALMGDRLEWLPVLRRGGRSRRRGWSPVAAVLRRPRLGLAAGVAVMLALAVPALGMSTSSAGVATLPESFASKQAYEVLQRHFPEQGMADAEIVVRGDATSPAVEAAVARLRAGLAADGRFGRPRWSVSGDRRVGRLTVRVAGEARDPEAIAAVRRLRARLVPEAFGGVAAAVLVGGETAREIDFFAIAERYWPIVVGVVLALSFVVLAVAFRSLVAPAVAIAMNLLSVGAAYGLLVLVFQHGVGAGALGLQQADAVEAWLPLFLFTVLFGLSMDYQVFLLSRIRERHDATGDTADAIRTGIGATARLITGAAMIMVAVFAGFAAGDLVMFQQMGFGLGVAVLLDATLVRCVLVPAAMQALGRWNWWLPAGLARRARLAPATA